MKPFPFLPTATWLVVLRVVAGLYMVAHGVARTYDGTVDDFGSFLDGKGFPVGVAIAWAITLNEIIAGLALAAGRFVRVISGVFAFQLLMGIILVQAQRGWWTLGHGVGGAEYPTLLILCFLLVASTERRTDPR